MSLFETSGAKPKGTLSAVKDFWAEYPSRFAAEWHLRFPGKRQAPAREIFGHLASSASPNRSAPSDAPAPSAPLSPWRATEPSPIDLERLMVVFQSKESFLLQF